MFTLSGFNGSPKGRPTLNSPPAVPTIKSLAGDKNLITFTLFVAIVYIKASAALESPTSKLSNKPDCDAKIVCGCDVVPA